MARCSIAAGRLERAREEIRRSLQLALELGVPSLQAGGVLTWAQALSASGEPALAEPIVRWLAGVPELELEDRRAVERWLENVEAVSPSSAKRRTVAAMVRMILTACGARAARM